MNPNQNQNQFPQQNVVLPEQTVSPVGQPVQQQIAPSVSQQNVVEKKTPVQALNAVTEDITIPQNQNVVIAKNEIGQSSHFFILYAVAAVVLMVFFWKRILEWLKRGKTEALPAEDDGTVCKTCGGTGKITIHTTTTVLCGHCKGTGNDSCHFCGGTGKNGGGLMAPETQEAVDGMMNCDYCGGTGFSTPRKMCCMCKGARKETFREPSEVDCPTCKGAGKK